MKYKEPEMEIVLLSMQDICTLSGDDVSDGSNEGSTDIPRI